MPYCPADCASDVQVQNISGDCELKQRQLGIARIHFINCDVTLPAPLTCLGLETLYSSGVITRSSPLANIEVADPSFEAAFIADCIPAQQIATSRTITFQDRVMLTGSEGSPATPVPFYENDFWADKMNKQAKLRYMIEYCDGSVQIAKDPNSGNMLEATLNVFRKFETTTNGNARTTYYYIQGTLEFKGDFVDLNNKPELTALGEVFNISTCDI